MTMMIVKCLAASLVMIMMAMVVTDGRKVPKIADQYTIKGRLMLPYAELMEPFIAYFDGRTKKSRIDYYGDLEQTFQREDLNTMFQISYAVDQKTHQVKRVCFKAVGDPNQEAVKVQDVLPNLKGFTLDKRGPCSQLSDKLYASDAKQCERWISRVTVDEKQNTYTMIFRRTKSSSSNLGDDDDDDEDDPLNLTSSFLRSTTNKKTKWTLVPVFYETFGFNTLMESHFDHYEIYYETYIQKAPKPDLFEEFQKFQCNEFPHGDDGCGGGGIKQARSIMNPMHSFIHNDHSHIDEAFETFNANHNRLHSQNEFHFRKHIFTNNHRFVSALNRRNLTFKLKLNHLADRTEAELGAIRGLIRPPLQRRLAFFSSRNRRLQFKKFDSSQYDQGKVPANWDWRLMGAVNPVKDQAVCGSCWAFGAVGSVEGQYFVKTGKLLKLSEQQLVDCNWPEMNLGCNGGFDEGVYHYLMRVGGLATTESYGPYLGVDGRCHDQEVKKAVRITGVYNITAGDAVGLKTALYNHGPVNVALDASAKTFTFYSHGIYSDPACGTNLNHQVLAIGYGEINGQKYWLIRNSWSSYWGNAGYILVNQQNNLCGILNDATFPTVV